MTDAPSQRQGKRVARAFSQIVVQLHSSRKHSSAGVNGDTTAADEAMHEPVSGLDGAFMPAEDPGVLYSDEDLSLLDEERWWTLSDSQNTQHAHHAQHAAAAVGKSRMPCTQQVCAATAVEQCLLTLISYF